MRCTRRAPSYRLGSYPPEAIYPEGDGAEEFQRTLSRLCEMQSEDYIANRATP